MSVANDSIWTYTGGSPTFIVSLVDSSWVYTWLGEGNGLIGNATLDTGGNLLNFEYFLNNLVLGLQPPMQNINVSVFPNPASTTLNIKLDYQGASTFELYDMQGKRIFDRTFKTNAVQFPVPAVPQGIYTYRITTDKGFVLGAGKLSLVR